LEDNRNSFVKYDIIYMRLASAGGLILTEAQQNLSRGLAALRRRSGGSERVSHRGNVWERQYLG